MEKDQVLGVRAVLAGVFGTLTAVWGWFGWLVLGWAALMLTDWLVGSALASRAGHWSSKKLREGALHKAGMILVFVIALAADLLIRLALENIPDLELPFEYEVMLAPLVVVWYIIGELGSLAEHAVRMGAPVPKWLLRVLDAGRRAVDGTGGKLTGEKPPEKDEEKAEKPGAPEKEAESGTPAAPEKEEKK